MPQQIGRYRVVQMLGRGAMGVIYQAHDPAIDRPVALKLVRADLLEGDEKREYVERFRREAQAAARCAHPNIVAIYDFAMHDGNPFIAMELVEGASLAAVLRQHGRFAPADAVAVMLQVLDALDSAHRIGVVHRDIKPANILLMAGNRVKITDFGIARFDTSDLTQQGAQIGTPSYMSPEQCMGEPVDARSDLFSSGTVLFEMLTGERPFPGRTSTEITYRLVHQEPADLAAVAAGVSPALAAVVRRALAKQASARFGSAREMAEALRASLVMPPDADTVMAQRTLPAGMAQRFPARGATGQTPGGGVAGQTPAGGVTGRMPAGGVTGQTSAGGVTGQAPAGGVTGQTPAGGVTGQMPAGGVTGQTPAGGVTGQMPAGGVGAAEAQRAEKALAQFVGPIAKVLVKRALPRAASATALWDALAGEIEHAADRAAFLRQRPPG